jgi:hypothetical protein
MYCIPKSSFGNVATDAPAHRSTTNLKLAPFNFPEHQVPSFNRPRILLSFAMLIAFFAVSSSIPCLASPNPAPASVTLAWDASPGQEVVDYKVYYGPTAGTYNQLVDVGSSTNATISGLEPGAQYFFAATATDAVGLESSFSNEIAYTVPLGIGRIELVLDPSRGLVLKGAGQIGRTYYIQASQDLVTWQVVNTVSLGQSDTFEVLNPVPSSYQTCFIRLSLNP